MRVSKGVRLSLTSGGTFIVDEGSWLSKGGVNRQWKEGWLAMMEDVVRARLLPRSSDDATLPASSLVIEEAGRTVNGVAETLGWVMRRGQSRGRVPRNQFKFGRISPSLV